jgi:protein-tyrosine phosphatase
MFNILSLFSFAPRVKGDFSAIGIDMHSHLLPAVDDGATSVAHSLLMINALSDMGFNTLYTTPHSIKDLYPNTLESLESSFREIKDSVPDGIILDYSSEYFLDELFLENLQKKRLKPLPGKRLLIEFSMVSMPLNLGSQFFDIHMQGYQIVLAHPERYIFFQKNFDALSRLKDMDIEFQVNALSLGGYYGDNVRQTADKLIRKGWIDFIGTDTHHENHLQALRKIPGTRSYQRLLDQGNLKNSTLAPAI